MSYAVPVQVPKPLAELQAQRQSAGDRQLRPAELVSQRPALRKIVARKLAQQWSPQQISGWLRCTFPSDADMHVSPETIYRSLFVQSRGVLRRCLLKQLRRQHYFRHARGGARLHPRQGQILDAVSIRERPAEVRDRAVPGHWEGDLLEGARGTFIATLLERQSRYVLLVRLPSKDTHTVTRAIARRIRRLPHGLMKSLTWDRGGELAAHRAFTVATNVKVYFCDPRSPWQRGSNENTNGLLRQYLPAATNLTAHSQAQLDAIALHSCSLVPLVPVLCKLSSWKSSAVFSASLLTSSTSPVR